MVITKKDLMQFEDAHLEALEDMIDEIQKERKKEHPVDIQRRQLAAAIKHGIIDFKESRTLMEFFRKRGDDGSDDD